jgi:hypothetical protein
LYSALGSDYSEKALKKTVLSVYAEKTSNSFDSVLKKSKKFPFKKISTYGIKIVMLPCFYEKGKLLTLKILSIALFL